MKQLPILKLSRTLLFAGLLGGTFIASQPALHAADAKMTLKLVAGDFVSPVVLVPFPGAPGKNVVVDQVGTLWILSRGSAPKLFADLRSRIKPLPERFDERGVLGLAFHPKFESNGRLFVFYTAPLRAGGPAGFDNTCQVAEFKVKAGDRESLDMDSEKVLLQIDHPQTNHNGGRLAFGPDGFLYISVGDGGAGNDVGLGHAPQGNGQSLDTLLGKLLRIDVDSAAPYGIPKDNPFKNGGGKPEIYAYGIRNPWAFSFDREGKRELFLADVGQDAFEEVNIIENGGNYGWNVREGFICFDPKSPTKPPEKCAEVGPDGKPFKDPILVYKNLKRFAKDPEGLGISITGGYVYRGKKLPNLKGRYVFADWSKEWIRGRGLLFVATRPSTGKGQWTMSPLTVESHPDGHLGTYVVALGEDADGELYILTNDSNQLSGKTGKIHRLEPM